VDGFVKATDVEFEVTTDKETQKIIMIDKVVSLSKQDIGGNEIEGAEMTVTDENNEIVDSWTSTKEPHHISNLEEGKKYVLHELYAPDTFVIATDVEHWENIKNEFNNKKRQYNYIEETFNIEDLFSETQVGDFSDFQDIIEYK